jgi:CHAD domain-containing protein
MYQSHIIKHYNQLIADFHTYFRKVRKEKRKGDIHDLRVTIKKLRAIWSLMQEVTQGLLNQETHNKLVAKLFKEAGKVREAQINLSTIQKPKRKYLSQFIKSQLKQQKQAEKRLKKTMKNFNKHYFKLWDKSWQQSVNRIPEEIIVNRSIQLINIELKKVQKLNNQPANPKKLHQIRITLKAVHEILNILLKLQTSPSLIKTAKKIKNLNQEIGKWHDQLVMLESLEKFKKTKMKKKDKAFLERLMQRLNEKEKLSQRKIHEKLKQFSFLEI